MRTNLASEVCVLFPPTWSPLVLRSQNPADPNPAYPAGTHTPRTRLLRPHTPRTPKTTTPPCSGPGVRELRVPQHSARQRQPESFHNRREGGGGLAVVEHAAYLTSKGGARGRTSRSAEQRHTRAPTMEISWTLFFVSRLMSD